MKAIDVAQEQIESFCRRHHIQWMALFGSVLRDDFTPASDVDVLVQFAPGHTPGWEFVAIGDELAEIFGRPVDLHTPASLSDTFRDDVLRQGNVIFVCSSLKKIC